MWIGIRTRFGGIIGVVPGEVGGSWFATASAGTSIEIGNRLILRDPAAMEDVAADWLPFFVEHLDMNLFAEIGKRD